MESFAAIFVGLYAFLCRGESSTHMAGLAEIKVSRLSKLRTERRLIDRRPNSGSVSV